MRHALLLLASTVGCGPDLIDPPAETPTSVRQRLEDRTRLQVIADASTGSITAEKRAGTGWDSGTIALPFANGAIEVSSDASDALTLEGMQIVFDTIALPDGLFGGREASLTGVRVEIENPVRATATWVSDDDVTLHVELPLALHWGITIDGATTPLGSPDLPKVPVDVRLTGDGEHVDATVSARAPGEIWSWAGILKLSELTLDIEAQLAPPL